MGINPAVFIANLYLFWYEYRFLLSLGSQFSMAREVDLFPYHQLPSDSVFLDAALSPLVLANQGVMPTTTRDVIRVVLGAFAFTKRFVDDLQATGNLLFNHLTYTTQSLGPITGIYPAALTLKPSAVVSAAGASIPFLDLLLRLVQTGGTWHMEVRLYDKRLDAKFMRLAIARFPHATSAISTGCKLNIITSRYVHLSRGHYGGGQLPAGNGQGDV